MRKNLCTNSCNHSEMRMREANEDGKCDATSLQAALVAATHQSSSDVLGTHVEAGAGLETSRALVPAAKS